MSNLLKKIVLDGTELVICDDTARTTADKANSTANTNKTNITSLTSRVSTLEGLSRVTASYSENTNTLTLTTTKHTS